MRKTIEVRTVISRINGALAAPNLASEARAALCGVAEGILHDTDNYQGFAYVDAYGKPVSADDIAIGEYEEYRRRYFIPKG